MENYTAIRNKEKTIVLSFEWETQISKEHKEKLYSLIKSALDFWDYESPTEPPTVFNEDALRKEIVRIWGEHGAHVDVYDNLLKQSIVNAGSNAV